MKGVTAFRIKTKHGEMSIQGRNSVDTQAPHHSEARAINYGEILVTPRNANIPGELQACQSNRPDDRYPAAQTFPKPLCSFSVKPVVKQGPRFDQNVIRGH